MTSQKKQRGPYRKGVERREQILQAAYEAIDELGDRASMHQIAARVGVPQPLVQYYFGTRDELLLAVQARHDAVGRAVVGAGSPDESMTALAQHTVDHPGLVKLYVALAAASTDPESPAHHHFTERYRELTSQLARRLEEGQSTGEYRTGAPPEHLARLLLAVMDGLQVQWMNDPSVDMPAIVRTFAQLYTPPSDAAEDAEDAKSAE